MTPKDYSMRIRPSQVLLLPKMKLHAFVDSLMDMTQQISSAYGILEKVNFTDYKDVIFDETHSAMTHTITLITAILRDLTSSSND